MAVLKPNITLIVILLHYISFNISGAVNNSTSSSPLYPIINVLITTSIYNQTINIIENDTQSTDTEIQQIWLYWIILVALIFICCCGCFLMEYYYNRDKDVYSAQLYVDNNREKQIQDEIDKLDEYYSNNMQLSFFYYIFNFLFYSSTLIENILVYLYTDYNLYDETTPFYIMWALSICMLCYCTKWGFCVVSLQLIQMMVFLMLCNWSQISLIIFGSIFLFQFVLQCILVQWNNDPLCKCNDCKHSMNEDDELKEEKVYGESMQFVIFGNFECIPFLYYNALNAPFRSLWYQLILIWMFWIDSMAFDYKTYIYKYPQYFRPSKHWNHWFIALYLRVYIIFGFGFRFLNIALSTYYIIFYLNEMSNFEFGYTIFIIAFWGCCISGYALIIIFWKRFRETMCFGGRCRTFCQWFCCCKVDT